MNKLLSFTINIGIAAVIYGAATGAGAAWMVYAGVVAAVLFSLLSVIALAPISAYWAILIDTGLRETLDAQETKERNVAFLAGLCKMYENTVKMVDVYRNNSVQFYLAFFISMAIPVAILFGPGWTYVAFTVLVLDAIAFACIFWLTNNIKNVTTVTIEAVAKLKAIAPEIINEE